MRSLNSRSFFSLWQAAYAAANPDRSKDRWQVDGVDWTKERHAYWGAHYSVQMEVHRLECRRGDRLEWQLMVVTERWWGPEREKNIRDSWWCRAISGRPDRIMAWLRKWDRGLAR